MKTVCIFGDSITWGATDPAGGGWAARLRRSLEVRSDPIHHDYEFEMYTLGVCGDTTRDILTRFDTETKAREPNIVIFAVGINDSRFVETGENRVPESEFAANLAELTRRARVFTKDIVFIGLTRINEALDPHRKNGTIERYDALIREHCGGNGLIYIDVSDAVAADHLPDGLHPDEAGHERLFQRIKSDLEKIGIL